MDARSTPGPIPPHRRARRLAIAAAIAAAAVIAVRMSIDPLAHHFTQRGLDRMEGYRGTFSDVSFSLVALSYSIDDLDIREVEVDGAERPLFKANRVRARVLWRNLLHGEILGTARVEGLAAAITLVPGEEPKEQETKDALEDPPKPWQIDEAVQSLIPFRLERLEALDGEISLRAAGADARAALRFSQVEASIENFTTRRAVSGRTPLTAGLRCSMQQSGTLKLFLTADLLAEDATFSMQARLSGLQLAEISDFVAVVADGVELPRGELDLFASFNCQQGRLSGALKPILKAPEVAAPAGDLGDRLKAALFDAALSVFSDRVPGREAAAAILPIEGRITTPGIDLWRTIVTLLRNAFVEGLSASFKDLEREG